MKKSMNGTGLVNRRNFLLLAGTSAGLAGAAYFGGGLSRLLIASETEETASEATPPDLSRVVHVRDENVFTAEHRLLSARLNGMLAAGMDGLLSSGSAWRALFKPDDVVGIKVNCIAGPELSTHPLVVAAITSQLEQAGIPAENIIIWDRTSRELSRAGYAVNQGKKGVQCYGTDAVGYEESAVSQGSFKGRLSKILTRQITALINAPILKDHSGAGITISMKNHYGSIHNPGSQHKNHCDPFIADLNSVDVIRSKTRLIICDATRAACNGGPGYNPAFVWQSCGLLLSQDPVALDTIGATIIDERRKETGLPTLGKGGKKPRQLVSAAERGLGNTGSAKIALQKIEIAAK